MVQELSFRCVSTVLESWELARQRHGCVEDVGSEMVLQFLEAEPNVKQMLGFNNKHNLRSDPLMRIGILTYASMAVDMLDKILMALGPDMDELKEILKEIGETFVSHGGKSEHVHSMMASIRTALSKSLGKSWTHHVNQAWEEFLREVEVELSEVMVVRQ